MKVVALCPELTPTIVARNKSARDREIEKGLGEEEAVVDNS